MVVRAPRTPRKTVNTRPLAPLKICVVTQEFFVTNQKSESAAAVMGLAQQLAAVGDSVTLVWLPPPGTDRRLHLEEFEKIEQYCFEQYLIRVEVLQDLPDLHGGIHNNQMASLAVYNHIKCQDYDVVYFALEGGLGYYTLLAVELGLYSPRPRIYVLANLPLIWQVEANRRFHESRREISTSYMERYCISMPDRLISSTHYMVEWMKSRSWTLPKDVVVMSPIRPNELLRPNGPEAGPPDAARR